MNLLDLDLAVARAPLARFSASAVAGAAAPAAIRAPLERFFWQNVTRSRSAAHAALAAHDLAVAPQNAGSASSRTWWRRVLVARARVHAWDLSQASETTRTAALAAEIEARRALGQR